MGKTASGNPVAIREHPDPNQRSSLPVGPYPVVDSISPGVGVGTRHRGAPTSDQPANASYSPPPPDAVPI
jgi:hypothetical protein